MTWEALETAGSDLVRRLGPSALRAVIGHASDAWPRDAILRATPCSTRWPPWIRSAGLAYLTGLAAGYTQRAAEVSVETVWSDPDSHHMPPPASARMVLGACGRRSVETLEGTARL